MYYERSLACSLPLEIIVHHQAASLVLFHSQSVRLYFAPGAVARRQIQQSIKGDSSAYIAVLNFPAR